MNTVAEKLLHTAAAVDAIQEAIAEKGGVISE